jgi:CRISPR-associated protein Cmr2
VSRYLLAAALGPVQEFIAAGRKTRDLWFGSALLGEISRAAAVSLAASGATIIFPHLDSSQPESGRTPSAPNKLLAIVATNDPAELMRTVRAAAQAVLDDPSDYPAGGKSAFHGYVAHVEHELDMTGSVNWTLLREQVKRFLEFYAAWVPYGEGDDYTEKRQEVERLLAGRKALRDFAAAPLVEPGMAKSSLDPSRETVFRARNKPVGAGNALDETAQRRLKVKGAEQLDGISLLKRHAEVKRFVSVSRVAVDPLIRCIAGTDELADLNKLAAGLRGSDLVQWFPTHTASGLHEYAAFPYDCQLFYRDAAQVEGLTGVDRAAAAAFYAAAKQACAKAETAEPPAYFAVLAADGDKMGKAIAKLTRPEDHIAFSKVLSSFADEVDKTVQKHHGAPVYSGGDDVLAFLPLDAALDCAKDLAERFAAINKEPVMVKANAGKAESDKISVSLSVGLAIGHYHANLNDLLHWAREAEAFAKSPNGGNRNALAVALHTASGGDDVVMVAQRWSDEPDDDPVKRWKTWIEWHRDNRFPDGAAYELRELAVSMRALDRDVVRTRYAVIEDGAPAERNLLELELLRILKRKRAGHGVKKLEPAQLATIVRYVDGKVERLEQLAKELIIARRLAEVAALTWPAAVESSEENADA